GGSSPGSGNLIVGNTDQGIAVFASDNLILGNTIESNSDGIGVGVGSGGENNTISRNNIFGSPNANISLAGGANHGMPAPVLSTISRDQNNDFVVQGIIPPGQGPSSASYTVEFFGTFSDGGQAFLFSATVTPDGEGHFSVTIPVALVNHWSFLTATATALTGDTGPFSNALDLPRLP